MSKATSTSGSRDDEIDLGGPYGRIKCTFVDAVQCRADLRLRELPSGEVVTVEWLLGVPYWRSLEPGAQRRAGKVVAWLQAQGVIDLKTYPMSKKSTRYYQIP